MSTDFFWAYLAEDTGRYDNITRNGQVIVEGVTAQQMWWLSLDGGTTWTQTQGTGFTLAEGRHHVLIKRSENESPYLVGRITVDQTPPAAPTAEFSSNGQYITGVAEANTTVKVQVQNNGVWQDLGSTTAGADGRYSLRVYTLSNAESIQVVALDAAMNQSLATQLAAPLILTNLLATADNHSYLQTDFLGTEIGNALQHKTSFSLLSADLGPVLAADVVTRVFGAALHFDVAEHTQRQLTLKAQSGGVQVAAMYDLHIYKLDQVTNTWVSQHVESNWLKAILLGGVSGDFDITLDPGQYMMVLGNGLGVAALTGYTLKTINDVTLDYTQPVGASGETSGNVLQDIDLSHGLDVLPESAKITSVKTQNKQGFVDEYLVGAGGAYDIQGLYGVLHIQANGEYRYEIDAQFNVTQSVIENFSYEVFTASGAKSTANLTIHINAESIPQTTIDHHVIVASEPTVYTGQALSKVVDYSILDVDLLNPILGADALAFKGAMSFTVAEQTLRELTFKGASGGVEIGSKYNLVIYKLDPSTGNYIQHHVEEDWFKVILFGGASVNTTLSFTPGQYKVVLTGKTFLAALKGTVVEVVEDLVKDYSQPSSQTVLNPLQGDLTDHPLDQVLKVNQSFLNAEGVTQVQGQFGVFSIGRNGEYHYELNAENTAAYGQIESFSYLVRDTSGQQQIKVLNIQINDQQASHDLNSIVLETSNQILSNTHTDKPHRQNYEYNFKVDEHTVTELSLSVKVLSLLNDKRQLQYTLTNTLTGEIQKGVVTGKNPTLEQFKFSDLSAGSYQLSLNLDATSGVAGTITSVTVSQNSVYLSEFVANQVHTATGNLLDNDLGLIHMTGMSIAGQTIYTGAGQKSMLIDGEYGLLSLNIDGAYTYTAYGNASGIERFEYVLHSASGSQSKALLEIDVSQHLHASAANEIVINSSASDHLYLGLGQDSLVFQVLDNMSATAGNGASTWHDFQVAANTSNSQVDKIDVSALLPQVNQANIGEYLQLHYDQTTQTATLSIDRDGNGTQFTQQDLLYLTHQQHAVSLDDLIHNQQIVF